MAVQLRMEPGLATLRTAPSFGFVSSRCRCSEVMVAIRFLASQRLMSALKHRDRKSGSKVEPRCPMLFLRWLECSYSSLNHHLYDELFMPFPSPLLLIPLLFAAEAIAKDPIRLPATKDNSIVMVDGEWELNAGQKGGYGSRAISIWLRWRSTRLPSQVSE